LTQRGAQRVDRPYLPGSRAAFADCKDKAQKPRRSTSCRTKASARGVPYASGATRLISSQKTTTVLDEPYRDAFGTSRGSCDVLSNSQCSASTSATSDVVVPLEQASDAKVYDPPCKACSHVIVLPDPGGPHRIVGGQLRSAEGHDASDASGDAISADAPALRVKASTTASWRSVSAVVMTADRESTRGAAGTTASHASQTSSSPA